MANPTGAYASFSPTELQGVIRSLISQRDSNGGEQADPVFNEQLGLAGYDPSAPPDLNLPSMGGVGDIGIAGPNTGTITMPDGSKQIVNYYVGGTNTGEYRTDAQGNVYSTSNAGDTNRIKPTGMGFVGDNQPAYITPRGGEAVLTPPPKDTSTGALNLGAAFNELNSDGALTAVAAILGAEALPGLMGAGASEAGAAGSAGSAGAGAAEAGTTASTVNNMSLANKIATPIMNTLAANGVPYSVYSLVPQMITSGAIGAGGSSLTGRDPLTGGLIGAITGGLAGGLGIPSGLASLTAQSVAGALGFGGSQSGQSSASNLPTQTGANSGNPSGTSGNTTINAGGPMQTLSPAGNLMVHGTPAPVAPTPTPAPTPISYAYNNTTPANLNDSVAYQNDPMFGPTTAVTNAARGGLMHLAEGDLVEAKEETPSKPDPQSEIAARIERLMQLLAPATAKVPSMDKDLEEYLKRYQAQQERSTAKQSFISAIGSPTMRGRGTRPSQYAGMPNAQIESSLPSSRPSAMGLRGYTEMPNFMPTAKIPFAAHGGQIHPELEDVLQNRNVNVEHVAGPEGRFYAKHDIRGFAVGGPGTGQSDDIPTMLSDSEYVIDADTVAALGDGSSKAGAEALDKMRMAIRKHKRSASISDIPPKAKSPFKYIEDGRKMNVKKK